MNHDLRLNLVNLVTRFNLVTRTRASGSYNIWGVWNTLSTFRESFHKEGGDLTSLSEKLKTLIPLLYAFTASSNVLGRLVFSNVSKNPQGQIPPLLLLISCIVDVGLAFVLLELVKTMRTAIAQKAKRESV
ncbi:MAG: hypothetical protein IGS49_14255 [Chlorogloeopsis fritschii C42_A2020_084]|uniref:hypothetical protein n=1 Tax=Chlorogloeopsis fritschii TaxID=1124 RepID=UPI001A0A73A4|nr:hypothetical protein [Chlorogloeopsis fritschii]MBF2006589.1 hypothetical protein [Chlorogloeopsis fritschii C42_A2020_084]